MTPQHLFHMYQAWSQDNERYVERWVDFVEFAARQHGTTGDNIMRVLQTCWWFKRADQ